jgi:hypothetical protein
LTDDSSSGKLPSLAHSISSIAAAPHKSPFPLYSGRLHPPLDLRQTYHTPTNQSTNQSINQPINQWNIALSNAVELINQSMEGTKQKMIKW